MSERQIFQTAALTLYKVKQFVNETCCHKFKVSGKEWL